MKVINYKNSYYEVIEERGDFYYGQDAKGKVKSFLKKEVEVIEMESLPKQITYKSKKAVEKVADPVQTWKNIALSVNNKWNENTTWKLAEQTFGRMNANGDKFIESLLDYMFGKGRLTDKQAYFLAKFGVESGQLN